MAIKKGDFVEFDYIGKLNPSKQVFDTSIKSEAEEAKLQVKQEFGPKVVCVGKGQAIQGIDEALEGKNAGDEIVIDIPPEKAFGKRNPNMVQLTTVSTFKESKIMPAPGMQLNVGGMLATVKSVNGGRVLLDFNHPLSGRSLNYWIKVRRVLEAPEEKLNALAKLILLSKVEIDLKDGAVKVKFDSEITDVTKKFFTEQAKELVSGVKVVDWEAGKKVESKSKKKVQ